VKLLTEIGCDDFGKNEGRSPKIKRTPETVAAFKPNSRGRAAKPATQDFESKQLCKLDAPQLSFSPAASPMTSSPIDFRDFGLN
jgi:hypothetical protein